MGRILDHQMARRNRHKKDLSASGGEGAVDVLLLRSLDAHLGTGSYGDFR